MGLRRAQTDTSWLKYRTVLYSINGTSQGPDLALLGWNTEQFFTPSMGLRRAQTWHFLAEILNSSLHHQWDFAGPRLDTSWLKYRTVIYTINGTSQGPDLTLLGWNTEQLFTPSMGLRRAQTWHFLAEIQNSYLHHQWDFAGPRLGTSWLKYRTVIYTINGTSQGPDLTLLGWNTEQFFTPSMGLRRAQTWHFLAEIQDVTGGCNDIYL